MSIDYVATFWSILVYIIPMFICWLAAKNVFNNSEEGDMTMLLTAMLIMVSFLPIVNFAVGYLLALVYFLNKLKRKNK